MYPSIVATYEPVRDYCERRDPIWPISNVEILRVGSRLQTPKSLSTRVQLVPYVPNVRKRCLVQRTSQRSRTMGFKTLSLTAVGAAALVAPPTNCSADGTQGIFDGVKEAFSQKRRSSTRTRDAF